MCGIIGIFGRSVAKTDFVDFARNALEGTLYRGPDESRLITDDSYIIGFNRLAINHLDSGKQPKVFKEGSKESVLCLNGEIFNHKELESIYLSKPYGRDEVTVLADLYKIIGIDFISLLNGQFSILIYSGESKKVILARDPFGIRPLFYHLDHIRKALIVTSDIKSLWSTKVNKTIDEKQLARIHITWSTSLDKTIWKDVLQVRPGYLKVFDYESNEIRSGREVCFWDWCKKIESTNKNNDIISTSEEEARFRYELRQSVSRQSMSEVGIGSYLSGGIDSSAIAYELNNKDDELLKTYSISFKDIEYDESEKQELIVNLLDSENTKLSIGDEDIGENFKNISSFIQQPYFRTAPIPLYMLAEKVRLNGQKAVLTGEGADEILLGYDIFREKVAIDFIKENPKSKWRYKIFDRLYSYLPQFKNQRYRKLAIETLMREGNYGVLNPLKSRISNNSRSLGFLDNVVIEEEIDKLINEYDDYTSGYELDGVDMIQLFEINNLLSGYLLTSQGDRVAMANSVETRYPYLDLDFVNYALGLPRIFKLRGTEYKRILRSSYRSRLPKKIVDAPKIAYQAPEARAILLSSEIMDDLLSKSNPIYRHYSYEMVRKVINRVSESGKRGSFGDNMLICVCASLSTILSNGQG